MTTVAPAAPRQARAAASAMPERDDLRWMLGLTVLALALRLWFVLSVGQTKFAFNDAQIYDVIATNIANGHGFTGLYGQATAQWPPGYPFLLALAFRVFGSSPTTGEILNAVLGSASVPLLYFAARRTLGRPEAIATGIGMTVLLGQIIWTDVLVSESMFVFLIAVLLAVLAVVSPERPRSAVIVGLVLGVAMLTRGEGFLLLAFPLAMWWRQLSRAVLRRQAVIIVGVMLAFVIPWTIRNALAMHAFVPVSTNFASTFWAGHNPNANGGPGFPPAQLLAQVKAPLRSSRREIETSNLLKKQALSWMEGHPLDELKLIPAKLLALGGGDGSALLTWIDIQTAPGRPVLSANAQSRLVVLADFGFYALLTVFFASLAVFGKALWRRRPILRGPLAYLAIAVVVYGFVFYGGFRYHAALEPLMMLIAAPLLARLWALRAQRLGGGP